ncbi:uncharacterized protein LOC101856729 [Aplysia californica]|uniref:Uncharacterized protein LOC101856729 n=1 Tax=Aplysia californica TaxID=6500 RepID=A0ABM0JLI2_APLCA|nr:uncharacterized protein LOC101856729 [Aplysia californica]
MKYKKKSKSKKSSRSRKSSSMKLPVSLPSPSKKLKQPVASTSQVRMIKKRKLYDPESLVAAFKAVKDSSISVNAAAKQYGVPLTTLRDRVDGRISMETTRPGPPLLMAKEEESEIVHFLHTMARYGYRYTRQELAEIATDQAVEKGKRRPHSNGLTTKWVDSFISRWPSVRELSCKFKNKTDAEHTVRTYFDEIKKIIDRYKLLEKSDRIFNIMEISLSTDHRMQHSVSGKSGHQFKTENVTNTTLIACGSVSGRVLAPFFVFQASKLRPEMMTRVPSNVNASISETGKCSPQIFRRYLNEHFLPQAQRFDNEPILVLMDGSKAHMFVGMSEWGRANNVIFSFIPAHTTHLLQPLEVECADAIKKKYESVCRRHLKSLAGPCISRNSIGELACQAYLRAMTRHVIIHSFKKAGVFPDVSSDESGDDMDSQSYQDNFKSDDSNQESLEEVVFTEDLVVGQNQEVTEEEVVTTHEVVLSADGQPEEVVITPDGQLVLRQSGDMVVAGDGHLVIHGGEIFVNSGEHGFSHLQPIQLIQPMSSDEQSLDLKTESDSLNDLKECMIDHSKILDNSALELGSNSDLNVSVDQGTLGCDMDSSSDLTGGKHDNEDCDSNDDVSDSSEVEDENIHSGARTKPLSVLVKREANNDNHRHSVLLQKVLDIVQHK